MWSDEDIEAAKRALRDEGDVIKAAIKLSYRLRRRITKSSLVGVFKRRGLKVSDYIGKEEKR